MAQWHGVSLRKIVEHVKPLPYANTIAFYSFGDALYAGRTTTPRISTTPLKSECMLAFEMNRQPPSAMYGAPLRGPVENQLGYKMV